jgi:hypothetical protein
MAVGAAASRQRALWTRNSAMFSCTISSTTSASESRPSKIDWLPQDCDAPFHLYPCYHQIPETKIRFADLALSDCPCNSAGDRRNQRDGISQEAYRLTIGTNPQRLRPRQVKVVHRPGVVVGPAPVVGEQRVVRRKIGGVLALDPLRHCPMQRLALGVEQQALGRLLGDDMLEEAGQLGLRRLQRRQVELRQCSHRLLQLGSFRRKRVDCPQGAQREDPANDTGRFQGQLLRRGQPVNPARHHPVNLSGKLIWRRSTPWAIWHAPSRSSISPASRRVKASRRSFLLRSRDAVQSDMEIIMHQRKAKPMSNSARSVFAFAIYLIILGGILLVMPNVLLTLFGFPTTDEVWIRITAIVVASFVAVPYHSGSAPAQAGRTSTEER